MIPKTFSKVYEKSMKVRNLHALVGFNRLNKTMLSMF